MPPSPPTHKASRLRTLTASALCTASAGYTPPPVPPAQINNRTERPPFILFHFCRLTTLPRDVQHDTYRTECGNQIRTACADERQGVSCKGHQPHHHGHVNERLETNPKCHTGGEEGSQHVGRAASNAQTAPHQGCVQTH